MENLDRGREPRRAGLFGHAYRLMTNHYHLIIETPDGNLSYGMRQLNGIYTQRYNRAHHTVGHVLQGRFKSILIDKELYLLEVCRYVVLNPLRAHLVMDPSQWPWSSYAATAGDEEIPPLLTVDWIPSQFRMSKKRAQAHYRDFVIKGTEKEAPWKNLREGSYWEAMSSLHEWRRGSPNRRPQRDTPC